MREQKWLIPMDIYLNFQSTVLSPPSRKQSSMTGKINKNNAKESVSRMSLFKCSVAGSFSKYKGYV